MAIVELARAALLQRSGQALPAASVRPCPTAVRTSPRRDTTSGMHALKAHVRNGRIVVDEPTSLPEGAELSVVIADGDDELDAEERERLHESIERGLADMRAGREKDLDQFLDELE